MTILKNILFGCALMPLVVSTAFANNHMNSMKDHNSATKDSAQILAPMSNLSEKRAIRKQIAKQTMLSKGDNEGNINKMIHYSETSGTHNPHNSRIFDEMDQAEASVIELNPVRPTPTRPSISYDWADAPREVDKQIKK